MTSFMNGPKVGEKAYYLHVTRAQLENVARKLTKSFCGKKIPKNIDLFVDESINLTKLQFHFTSQRISNRIKR